MSDIENYVSPSIDTFPVRHEIAFRWGELIVTQAADLAYGLQPQISAEPEDAIRLQKSKFPKTHIALFGPEELSILTGGETDGASETRLFSRSRIYGKDLFIDAGIIGPMPVLPEGGLWTKSKARTLRLVSESETRVSDHRAGVARNLAALLSLEAYDAYVHDQRDKEQIGSKYVRVAGLVAYPAIFAEVISGADKLSDTLQVGTSIAMGVASVIALVKFKNRNRPITDHSARYYKAVLDAEFTSARIFRDISKTFGGLPGPF